MSPPRNGTFNTHKQRAFRKELRNARTPAEGLLWKYLRNRQLLGKKFRRQQSIGRYIVDFYCPECRLVVELDGAGHYGFESSYDDWRTQYFRRLGLKILRIENKRVYRDVEFVLEEIKAEIRKSTPSAL